jgi:heme exporter protein A
MPEDRRMVCNEVAFVGHDSYLYDDLTALENLKFTSAMGGRPLSNIEILEVLDAVGIGKAASSRVRTYSAGMKRRVGLARLLLQQPRILLLDEPHVSLDADGQSLIDMIVRQARNSGRAAVIASHDHARTLGLSTDVLVLDGGRVTYHGEPEGWRSRAPLWLVGKATS